jgi:hypothetical protein
MRRIFLWSSLGLTAFLLALCFCVSSKIAWAFVVVGPVLWAGFEDYFQKSKAIRRNFPLLGRFRYWFEAIRPEIN